MSNNKNTEHKRKLKLERTLSKEQIKSENALNGWKTIVILLK